MRWWICNDVISLMIIMILIYIAARHDQDGDSRRHPILKGLGSVVKYNLCDFSGFASLRKISSYTFFNFLGKQVDLQV